MHRLSDKDTESMTATCAVCGPVGLRFRPGKNEYVCRTKWQENDRRRKQSTRVPGSTPTLRKELMEKQDGRCAICTEPFDKPPHLDHCHETGKIRGLLCHQCNLGLGLFRDNQQNLQSAIEYLRL